MFSSKFNIGVLKHPGYNIGGGIGEAALIGAAFGGAKSLATGDDVLEGALLGGITGGAMSGITGAMFGKEALTGATGTVAKDAVTGQTLASSIPGTTGVGAFTNAINSGATVADDVLAASINQASQTANAGLTGLGGMQNVGLTQGAGLKAMEQAAQQQALANTGQAALSSGLSSQTPQGLAALNAAAPAADRNTFEMIRDYAGAKPGSTTAKALDFAADNPVLTSAGLGGTYGLLQPPKPPKFDIPKEEKSKLAGFDPDNFTPYEPATPNPYYKAQYAAEGGTMQSYAQGGITALAQGGMGGNMGYPQGRLDRTYYATPSQMPISAQEVNSTYETPTEPNMGSPLKMAEGGVASYAPGGQVYYDPQKGQYYTQGTGVARQPMGMNGYNPADDTRHYINADGRPVDGDVGGKLGGSMLDSNFKPSEARPEVYQQVQQAQQTPMTDFNPNSAVVAAQSVASPSYDAMMQGVAPQDFNRVFSQVMNQNLAPQVPQEVVKKAQGGIAGYAGGGIPQARNLSELGNMPGALPRDSSPTGNMSYINGGSGWAADYYAKKPAPVPAVPAAPTTFLSPDFQTSQATPNMYQPQYEQYASGGIAGYSLGGYAAGGNPRLLKGPGDGMSDNIPATIGGRQPARLADGEFVVPADVVSHLGNGSTDAGAKHLYKMMDKVRTARTGKKAQGKQIKPEKFMPR